MIRVLFIARYRDDTMRRKVAYLARETEIRAIEPAQWRDEFHQRAADSRLSYVRQPIAMWGAVNDPHRAFYRTVTFGLSTFQPHIIHAEEEPDSLAALQIALARVCFAPQAKLLLHTWQNVARRQNFGVKAVNKFTLSAASAIFCANREAQGLLKQRGFQRPTPLIPAVGVDVSVFTPQAKQPHSGFVLGFFGRLSPEKDVPTILAALAQLPDEVRLHIVGNGPQKNELIRQTAQLQLTERVIFRPPRLPVELPAELAKIDALVLPSRTTPVWKEQLGRVLLEAMACRIPVIGSSCGAIPEVVAEAGLLFAESNASQLAERVQQLRASPELCATLAERGYRRAHVDYSQEQLAARTLTFYTHLFPP